MQSPLHPAPRRTWIATALAASVLTTSMLATFAAAVAQEPRERPRGQPDVAERRAPDDRGQQQGTPEGLPQTRIAPPGDDRGPYPISGRWILGVHAYNTNTGVVITRVLPRSGAWEAGLEPGDVIVTVDGFQVGHVGGQLYTLGDELQHRAGPRGRVRLLVQNVRNHRLVNLDATLHRDRDIDPQPRER